MNGMMDKKRERGKERERARERETDRQTDRQTVRHADRERETNRQRQRERGRQTDAQRPSDRPTDRQIERGTQTDTQKHRERRGGNEGLKERERAERENRDDMTVITPSSSSMLLHSSLRQNFQSPDVDSTLRTPTVTSTVAHSGVAKPTMCRRFPTPSTATATRGSNFKPMVYLKAHSRVSWEGNGIISRLERCVSLGMGPFDSRHKG